MSTSSEQWEQDAAAIRAAQPRHILFLCVGNSSRSQLAEGIARSLAPAGTKISSAGSVPTRVHPLAVAALAELGIDTSSHRSKSVNEIPPDDVDVVVALCAEESCPVFVGKALRIHWPLPDPSLGVDGYRMPLDGYRRVRDELRRRLEEVFRPGAER
jgi:arsenate reductase